MAQCFDSGYLFNLKQSFGLSFQFSNFYSILRDTIERPFTSTVFYQLTLDFIFLNISQSSEDRWEKKVTNGKRKIHLKTAIDMMILQILIPRWRCWYQIQLKKKYTLLSHQIELICVCCKINKFQYQEVQQYPVAKNNI